MNRFFFLLTFAALFAACGGPAGEEVTSSDAADAAAGSTELLASAVYAVDTTASTINWEGAKIAYSHVGTAPVTDGKLMVADGKLVGGKFTIDLRRIANSDIPEAEKKAKLVGHLQSADFFDVATYPTADFEITQIQPATGEDRNHEITGNLMMKGQTRSITIPAMVSMEGDMIKAVTPKFTINRTEWGVNYNNSGIAGIIKDDIINDEIGLEIMLTAKQ